MQRTTKPLLHLTTARAYPETVAILERYGRTVEAIDETHPIYAKITDSAGTVHRVKRIR